MTGRPDYETDASPTPDPAEETGAASAAREASIEERRDEIRRRQQGDENQ